MKSLSVSITTIKTALIGSAVFWYILILILPLPLFADEPAEIDSTLNYLPDLEVRSSVANPLIQKSTGELELKGKDVAQLSRTLGEADFINNLKNLTEISTGSDYATGFSVGGNDATQIQYLADEIPLTFPYRFGGIFSVFNPAFYTSMSYHPFSPASLLPRLGPAITFTSKTRFSPGVEGAASVGLMASSAAIRFGIAEKVSIALGGRISYVDQIYGSWLRRESYAMRFSFNDLNAAVCVNLTSNDKLKATFFQSGDNVSYDDRNYSTDTRLHWINRHYGCSYRHTGEWEYGLNIYSTYFSNSLYLTMPQFSLTAPSSLTSAGGNGYLKTSVRKGILKSREIGVRFETLSAFPQSATMVMTGDMTDRASIPVHQRMWNLSVFGAVEMQLFSDRSFLTVELPFGFFNSTERDVSYRQFYATPRLAYRYLFPTAELVFSTGFAVQPVHRVGFSELGLSSDFWIGGCKRAPLQHSFHLSLRYQQRLPWWGLQLEGMAYWKRLKNQVEYQGVVMEVIDIDYDPFSKLIVSNGDNYGFSLTLRRMFGNLTGEVGYAFAEGQRHDKSTPYSSWHPLTASGHSLKGVLTWNCGDRWIFSATLNISSGRRFTPVSAIYAIGNNIAMEFGTRNSAKLPSYQRLDLGATYKFRSGRKYPLSHLVNISLVNAYGHKNVEMQYFILNTEKGTYQLKRLYSLYRFLPSLSYTIEF